MDDFRYSITIISGTSWRAKPVVNTLSSESPILIQFFLERIKPIRCARLCRPILSLTSNDTDGEAALIDEGVVSHAFSVVPFPDKSSGTLPVLRAYGGRLLYHHLRHLGRKET